MSEQYLHSLYIFNNELAFDPYATTRFTGVIPRIDDITVFTNPGRRSGLSASVIGSWDSRAQNMKLQALPLSPFCINV
ncbi:hypothetical protein [Thiohalophilus thiocyanatoxydans]|uniref:hypothetical protein n=1 Tax=Thiohalophilus thiocyanatoxydans TaxID=381308 RepID=UPI001065D22A|nr:hypothetical protein [Thiohalophilus thiocyanatoxydans]